jgi:uncharacterized membrane protein
MSLVHLHLLLNHVPVIGMLFVLFVLVAAFRARSSDMGKLGLVMLAGIGAVTALVYFTGEPAEDAVEKIAGVSRAMIHDHEEAAEAAFIATSIAGVLALAMLWWHRRRELPRSIVAVVFAVALGVSGLMAWTANLGGQIRHSEIRSSSSGVEARRDVN